MRVKREIIKARNERDEFSQIVDLLHKRAESRGLPFLISTEIAGYVIEVRVSQDIEPELIVYRYGRLLRALTEAKRITEAGVNMSLESAFEQELEQAE